LKANHSTAPPPNVSSTNTNSRTKNIVIGPEI
jgi:hypothetical protein